MPNTLTTRDPVAERIDRIMWQNELGELTSCGSPEEGSDGEYYYPWLHVTVDLRIARSGDLDRNASMALMGLAQRLVNAARQIESRETFTP